MMKRSAPGTRVGWQDCRCPHPSPAGDGSQAGTSAERLAGAVLASGDSGMSHRPEAGRVGLRLTRSHPAASVPGPSLLPPRAGLEWVMV